MTINPPSGYYTVFVDPQGGPDIVSNTIVNPIQPPSIQSFKVKFYPLQEEPNRYLGESAGLNVTRPEARHEGGNSTLMFPSVEFEAYLGSDRRTTVGSKQGRSYGKLIGTDLLQGVGGHRFRFKTAHSTVSTPANPTTDIVEAAGTNTYQIKTPESFLNVKQQVSGALRTITISFYDQTQPPGAVVNGLYTLPTGAPKGPSYRFQQLEASSGSYSLKYTSYPPGQDPDATTPPPQVLETKTVSWNTAADDTESERLKFTYQIGAAAGTVESEISENSFFPANTSIDGVTYSEPLRIEAFRKVLGLPTSNQVLETERRVYQLHPSREDLVRHERGSVSGGALPSTWAANEALTWSRSDYDFNGRIVLSVDHKGQWQRFDHEYLSDGGRKTTVMHPSPTLADNGIASSVFEFLSSGRASVSATTFVAWGNATAVKRMVPLYKKTVHDGSTIAYTEYKYDGLQGGVIQWSRHEFLKANPNSSDYDPLSEPQLATLYSTYPDDYSVGLGARVAGRDTQIVHSDGSVTTYAFDTAGLLPGWMRTVVRRDPSVALSLAAPATGTHLWEENIEDGTGRLQRESTLIAKKDGASAATQIGVATWTDFLYFRDAQGRDVEEQWRDGTRNLTSSSAINQVTGGLLSSRTVTDNTARQSTITDASGTETIVTRDVLNRPVSTRRSPSATLPELQTTTAYTHRTGGGRVETVMRDNLPNTEITSYDTAGRLLSSKDAADLTTAYSYTVGAGGTWVTTKTLPSTATELSTEWLDGKVVSRSGTAGVVETYSESLVDDSIDPAPPFSLAPYNGYLRRTTQVGSARLQHQIVDGAGRVVARYGSGDAAQYVYSGTNLVSVVRPGVISAAGTGWGTEAREYDGLSRLKAAGWSLDADSLLTTNSTDRIRWNRISYELMDGAWWERTETWFPKNTTGTSLSTSAKAWRRLSSLPASSLVAETRTLTPDGLLTRTRTFVDPALHEQREETTQPQSNANINTGGASSNVAKRIWQNGLLVSESTHSVTQPTTYSYDEHGRLAGVRDPLTRRLTEYIYNGQGQLAVEIDVAGNQKTYAYYGQGQLGAGRVSSITQPGGETTTYQYNARGQVTQQAGSGSYPIDYTYHPTDGWLTEMWTYTSSVAPATANKTYWEYDPATGLLWHKKDHLLRTTSYEYYSGTRLLQKRLWQRTVPIAGTPRLTTTYSYDKGGLLSKVEYNDGTPTTLVTYDRASRKTGVIDAAGSTGYSLSDGGFALNENISASTSANLLAGYWITRTKDAYGRPSSVYASGPPLSMVGGNPSYSGYTYDPATGRVASLARQSNGTPYVYGTSVSVAYVPDSDHVQTWTSGNWKQTFGYDENGRLNQAMAAKYSGANPIPADTLGYYYGYDTLNRRNLITREDGSFWDIGYNTRSEVTAAKQRRGPGSSNYLPGRQFTYAYDNLGNRTTARSGGVTSGSEASLRTTTYAAANALNQYSLITNPSTFDVTGISLSPANYNPSDPATEPVAVKVGTGAQLKATTRNPPTASTYARWHRESTSTVTTGSQARVDSVTVYENGTVKNTGKMSLPAPSQSLAYDFDGNLTDDGVWLYTWDGENRLKSMEHKDYGGSASKLYYKLTFDYDSQSRRIRKQVQTKTTFGGAWGGATSHLFVYDDWNLLLWINGSVAKQGYHWLPDMSGTWQGAGGVRGLVGISYKDQGGAAYYWSLNVGYDGNGNVVGLYGDVGGSTGLYAVYEYDPFGNTIRQNVTPAGNSLATTLGENPFRFSTKFTDDESKLLYYGFRYYSAGLGRWLNRDPIGERGGLNLYGMVKNNPVRYIDTLGRALFDIGGGPQSNLNPGDFGAQFLKGPDGKPNGKIGPKFLPLSAKYCDCLDMLKGQLKSDSAMIDIYKKLRDAKKDDGSPANPTPDDIFNGVDAETKPKGAQTAGQTDKDGKASSNNLGIKPPCNELHESITAIHEQAIQNQGAASTTGAGYANEEIAGHSAAKAKIEQMLKELEEICKCSKK